MTQRSTIFWLLLVCGLFFSNLPLAAAQFTYVPVYPMDPYYYPYGYPPPEHLRWGEQLVDFSLNGLRNLCASNDNLCDDTTQQHLEQLNKRRTIGISLIATGIAATIAGPLWTALSVHTVIDSDGEQVYCANYAPLIVGLLLGISLPITGGILLPRRSDLLQTISRINRLAPEKPIELQFGALGPRIPLSVLLAMHF